MMTVMTILVPIKIKIGGKIFGNPEVENTTFGFPFYI